MAVFLVNICKFSGCGLTYPSLSDLIQHIEETHIERELTLSDPINNIINTDLTDHHLSSSSSSSSALLSPSVASPPSSCCPTVSAGAFCASSLVKPPASIPLSSALRFYSQLPHKKPLQLPALTSAAAGSGGLTARSSSVRQVVPASLAAGGDASVMLSAAQGPASTSRRANSTGSTSPVVSDELDDSGSFDSDNSNDSWTTQEEFSSEFIMRYGAKPDLSSIGDEKPYACPVPGCTKRYKNVNGIKYHAKNGHKKDSKVKKMFRCHCGKSYKTSVALRAHATAHHQGVPLTTISTASGEVLQIPSSQVASLQPVRVSFSALMSGQLSSLPIKTVVGVPSSSSHAAHTTSTPATQHLFSPSFKNCLLPRRATNHVLLTRCDDVTGQRSRGSGQVTSSVSTSTTSVQVGACGDVGSLSSNTYTGSQRVISGGGTATTQRLSLVLPSTTANSATNLDHHSGSLIVQVRRSATSSSVSPCGADSSASDTSDLCAANISCDSDMPTHEQERLDDMLSLSCSSTPSSSCSLSEPGLLSAHDEDAFLSSLVVSANEQQQLSLLV